MCKELDELYAEVRNEAIAEGRAEGRAEGIVEGEVRGEVKGRAKEKKAIALSLLAQKVSAEIIAQATGLSVEEIKKL